MPLGLSISLIAAALIAGTAIGFIIRKVSAEKTIGSAEDQAKKILEDAIKAAESAKKEYVLSGREEVSQLKKEADLDIK